MSNGPSRVLGSLRRAGGRRCSGEALSHELGVSRAQIWKHVEALRAAGYEIAGEPGGGYRLVRAPDRLYPDEIHAILDTRWLGREIHFLESTDSTNRVALELARSGAASGTCVIAESQTAGRGRLGRRFFSPPFANLYTSLVLRPELALAQAPTVILAAAVAVADAVAETVDDEAVVEIKWPNDVLLAGRKTSGILMESSAEAARVVFLVLGIGVNLNVDPATFPSEFRESATSLAGYLGRPVDRVGFTGCLFGKLEQVLDLHAASGFEALRTRFESRFRMAGRPVRVTGSSGCEWEGTALGIDTDGALLVSREGETTRVLAGDVTLGRLGGRT